MRRILQDSLLPAMPSPPPSSLVSVIQSLPAPDQHIVDLVSPAGEGAPSTGMQAEQSGPTLLLALAAHPLANFAAQRAVERAAEAGMVLQTAAALLPFTSALLTARREGVVAAVVSACAQGGSLELQRASVGALQRAAALARCRSGARGLVAWLLDVDGARGRAAEESKASARGEARDSDDGADSSDGAGSLGISDDEEDAAKEAGVKHRSR